jgi:hypothetical protein
MFTTVFKTDRYLTLSKVGRIRSTLLHYVLRDLLYIIPSTQRSPSWHFPFQIFRLNVYIYKFPMHATCRTTLIFPHFINIMMWAKSTIYEVAHYLTISILLLLPNSYI